MKSTYTKMLSNYDIPDLIKTSHQKWSDVSLWPQVDLEKAFAFVIQKKAFKTAYIRQYTSLESLFIFYEWICPMFIKNVVLKPKLLCHKNQHSCEAWVLCLKSGDVLCGYCTRT